MPKRSAGRVQSVATRMIVERERARMRFRSATWWGVEGTFAAPQGSAGGDAPARFTGSGEETSPGAALVLDEESARSLASSLEEQIFAVRSVTEKPFKRSPSPP